MELSLPVLAISTFTFVDTATVEVRSSSAANNRIIAADIAC
jgi:hypothetical protein